METKSGSKVEKSTGQSSGEKGTDHIVCDFSGGGSINSQADLYFESGEGVFRGAPSKKNLLFKIHLKKGSLEHPGGIVRGGEEEDRKNQSRRQPWNTVKVKQGLGKEVVLGESEDR